MARTSVQRMVLLVALLLLPLTAWAQADVTSATVRGTVTDAQGAAIPNATLTIKSTDQGTVRTVQSDAEGVFVFLTLRPGPYELTAQAQGFAQQLVKDIQLTIGQIVTVELKLQVAAVTTEVTITDAAPLIEVERTQQSNTIENRQIESLPNIGRDFTSYVFTLPGVASSSAPRVQGGSRFTFGSSGFSIGGSNGRSNLITVDGGENEYGSGQLRFGISPEAVQEFQVNRSSFNAEFGFTSGTAVNVITKGGTNAFHGSAYTFYRSDKTQARERFVPSFVPSTARTYQQQVYPGFTFGGPIAKNKLFFFTNYERQKLDLPRFRNYTGNSQMRPSTPQEAVLARLAGTPATAALATSLRNALSTNATSNTRLYNLLRDNEGIINAPFRLNSWISRIDWNPTASDTISGRFSLQHNFNEQMGTDPLQSFSNSTTLDVRDYTSLISWTRNFGSNVVNQMRVQFSPRNSAITTPRPPGSTALVLVNVGQFNRSSLAPFNTLQDRYQFENVTTWVYSNHTMKFGFSYRPVKYTVRNDLWIGGEWNFSPGIYPLAAMVPKLPAADQAAFVANVTPTFLCATFNVPADQCAARAAALNATLNLNAAQSFNADFPFLYRQGFGNSTWQGNTHTVGGFAQDSWKVNSRFTLDYGWRVDYDGQPNPVPDRAYVSPRLGFAWDVTGDNKTVLRGGGGIFFAPVYYQIGYLTNLLNDTGQYTYQAFRSPAFPAGLTPRDVWLRGLAANKLPFQQIGATELGGTVAPKSPGRVVIEVDPDYSATYSAQASLAINRQITNSLGLEVAYTMYRGVHIQQPVPINYCEAGTPGCTPTAANAAALATRNPAFGPLYQAIDPTITQHSIYSSRGNSNYHGMTAALTKRFSNNFSFLTSYTWSKTIDDVTDFNTAFYAPFPTRIFLDRALSSFDIRHNFVMSGQVRSPWKNAALRDFNFAPIVSVRTGIPFTLTTGVDINGDTRVSNDRLFHIGRNTGLGPKFASVDFRLNRAFRFKSDGNARLEVLVECINLFNRTNFSSVRDIIPPTVGADGKFTEEAYNAGTVRLSGRRDKNWEAGQALAFQSAFDPRRFQFGLKLVF